MKTEYLNCLKMAFHPIVAGSFLMGDPPDARYANENTQQHNVVLTRGFHIQTTAVTVGQWRVFAEETGYRTFTEREGGWSWMLKKDPKWKMQWLVPRNIWTQSTEHFWDRPGFQQTDDHPVTCVTWDDVQEFIEWLSHKDGRQYRLPTEAEWEYVCRASTRTDYYFGHRLSPVTAKYHSQLISLAVHLPRVDKIFQLNRPVPVHTFQPNQWGIYNMHGNVWEWCNDSCDVSEDGNRIFSDAYHANVSDPLGQTGSCHILRGGSWAYPDFCCRSAHRRAENAAYNASGIGFRLVTAP